MTASDPVVGVALPGGPRTIPGCQVLNAGGELTVPRTSEAMRSGRQSLVAWARAYPNGRAAIRTAGRTRCFMATPLEAERPRDGSPGADNKNPGLLGAGGSSVAAPRSLSRERSVTTS